MWLRVNPVKDLDSTLRAGSAKNLSPAELKIDPSLGLRMTIEGLRMTIETVRESSKLRNAQGLGPAAGINPGLLQCHPRLFSVEPLITERIQQRFAPMGETSACDFEEHRVVAHRDPRPG